ncbi:response regulator transcription factor NblR [Picosynechococcus sp. PCC 8807]|uniref:response regulator transcription factor NblR n=1 Tax=Picosynechococcus sp. PCC 8807 TaxID=195248 RepID=UPI000810844A|nr:response regulator transcription factor [Picosynechococcus sp. PCC 8807]ANV89375.1 DNA-binding response regulator [Picosynechococcus sp. PCC 8807]
MPQSQYAADGLAYVLLVGTDQEFTQRATLDLADLGYQTITVETVEQAQQRLQQLPAGMVIVDYPLLGQRGIDFCRSLRKAQFVRPILFLVTQDRVEERVICLEAGADDYVLQPYQQERFLRLLKIYLQPQTGQREQLFFGDLILDLNTRQVWRSPGQSSDSPRPIELTVKEFELLKYLMSHPQQVLTREQILENVWGNEFQGESNVIEVYIRYLRLKIEAKGQKRLIQTVRGVGYVLKKDP